MKVQVLFSRLPSPNSSAEFEHRPKFRLQLMSVEAEVRTFVAVPGQVTLERAQWLEAGFLEFGANQSIV